MVARQSLSSRQAAEDVAQEAFLLAFQRLSQLQDTAKFPGWLFANSINVTEENSSSPETEREIVAAHSYGQQLGRIMDVLDELIRKQPAGSLGARPVREFAELRDDIDTIKARQAAKRAEQMVTDLAAMKRRDPDEYQRLAAELRKVLEKDSGD